jgi:hypothetical protein
LLNLQHYIALIEEAVGSPMLIYIAGLLALTGGLAMLNAYRAWTTDWRVVVTVPAGFFQSRRVTSERPKLRRRAPRAIARSDAL